MRVGIALAIGGGARSPYPGPDIVLNGNFDTDTIWIKAASWTIGGGVATKTAGVAESISQPLTLVNGGTYRCTYTATRTAGFIRLRFTGGTTVQGTARNTSGTFVDDLVVIGNTTLELFGDAAFAGTVDSITVRRIA